MKDPNPEKGRALGRLEEKQGRKIEKTGGRQQHVPGEQPAGDTGPGAEEA